MHGRENISKDWREIPWNNFQQLVYQHYILKIAKKSQQNSIFWSIFAVFCSLELFGLSIALFVVWWPFRLSYKCRVICFSLKLTITARSKNSILNRIANQLSLSEQIPLFLLGSLRSKTPHRAGKHMIGALDFYFTSFHRSRRCSSFFFIYTTEILVSDFQSFGFAFVFFFHLLCLFVCLAFITEILLTSTELFARSWFYSLYLFPFRRCSLVFQL